VRIEIISLAKDPNYVKCPRCWKYHAVKDNFMSLCDTCCRVLLEDEWLRTLDDKIAALQDGISVGEDHDLKPDDKIQAQLAEYQRARADIVALQKGIRAAFRVQAERYKRAEH
jgi:hypothetical protein